MKDALWVLAAFTFLLCGCEAVYSRLPARLRPSCSAQSAEFIADATEVLEVWDDTVALAEGTARIAWFGPVTRLQELRRAAGELEAPQCALPVKDAMLDYMDYAVDGFLAFMGQTATNASDPKVATLMLGAQMTREGLESALEDLRSDRPMVVPTVDVPELPIRLIAPARYNITYRVSGSARGASVTFENAQGGTEQFERVSPPWNHTMVVDEGSFLYLSVQNQGEHGSVTCEIELNGRSWRKSSSTGGYVIASCSGSAGEE